MCHQHWHIKQSINQSTNEGFWLRQELACLTLDLEECQQQLLVPRAGWQRSYSGSFQSATNHFSVSPAACGLLSVATDTAIPTTAYHWVESMVKSIFKQHMDGWMDAYTTLACVRIERYASPTPRAKC